MMMQQKRTPMSKSPGMASLGAVFQLIDAAAMADQDIPAPDEYCLQALRLAAHPKGIALEQIPGDLCVPMGHLLFEGLVTAGEGQLEFKITAAGERILREKSQS